MTTGRINQVAFLFRQAAPCTHLPDARPRRSTHAKGGRLSGIKSNFGKCKGIDKPCVRSMNRIREISRPSWATLAHIRGLGWKTRAPLRSSESPLERETDGRGQTRQPSSTSYGRRHRGITSAIIETPRPQWPGVKMRRMTCRPFGARARSQTTR
jgi:hypothetical protein